MIYNEGTLQQAQREMRRRHRRLQSQDPVAYAASEARCRQRLEALLLAQGQSVNAPMVEAQESMLKAILRNGSNAVN